MGWHFRLQFFFNFNVKDAAMKLWNYSKNDKTSLIKIAHIWFNQIYLKVSQSHLIVASLVRLLIWRNLLRNYEKENLYYKCFCYKLQQTKFMWLTLSNIQKINVDFILFQMINVKHWNQQQVHEALIDTWAIFRIGTFVEIQKTIHGGLFELKHFSIDLINAIRFQLQLQNKTYFSDSFICQFQFEILLPCIWSYVHLKLHQILLLVGVVQY